ncbi:unnamed protein product [Microthlaspi erraticum]|uniref:CCHC-type domain-containing protein n=2 Tax=Microthlaspi erraticum TaxID=1685480 RepID=A0A6D2IK50_9BRAS|nr:unnamed protein product [Microthlaspi erraticum]
MVASLEQLLDLKTVSFVDIVRYLKASEERILDEEESQEEQSKLMYVNLETHVSFQNRDFRGDSRGRGRGGRFMRGRGRGGRFMRGRGRGPNGGRDISKITCFWCDKLGHFASQCPDRLLKLQETHETNENDTEDVDKLITHEVVYLNEKHCVPNKFKTNINGEMVWYLDNGTSNHMTGDRRYFYKLDSSIIGKVRFGDDSCIDIKGKGTIAFTDLNR